MSYTLDEKPVLFAYSVFLMNECINDILVNNNNNNTGIYNILWGNIVKTIQYKTIP